MARQDAPLCDVHMRRLFRSVWTRRTTSSLAKEHDARAFDRPGSEDYDAARR